MFLSPNLRYIEDKKQEMGNGILTMYSAETTTQQIKQRLAKKYTAKGARLFISGSFARSEDRKTSDLDLGVLWTKERIPEIFSDLYLDVQEMPIIRKIDLVDMGQVDQNFKKEVLQQALFLDHEYE